MSRKVGEVFEDANGRRTVVICEWTSYGGGSGPLIAQEGEHCEFATFNDFGYRHGVCVAVSDEFVRIQTDMKIETIPLKQLERYHRNPRHYPSSLLKRRK